MSVSMSLLIAGLTLCSCDEIFGDVDNPATPTTPNETKTPETPSEVKPILSEISVESEGNNGVLAFTYGDDGKVTKAAYKSIDPFTGDSNEGLSCTFTYDTDKITVKARRDDNVETKVYTLTDGIVTKYSSDYGYNEFTYQDGKLIGFKAWDKNEESGEMETDEIFDFTWNEKVIASYEKYELNANSEKEDVNKYTVTYGDVKAGVLASIFFYGGGVFELPFYVEDLAESAPIFDKLGAMPEYLPEKLVRTWKEEGNDVTRTITAKYTLDSNNLVTKVVVKVVEGENTEETTYNLKWK